MKINDNIIEKLSVLSRLNFEKEAKEKIKKDLERILDLCEKLNEIDTENVEPLIFMTDEQNVLRDDVATGSLSKKEALKNAPAKDSDYFKVPKFMQSKSDNLKKDE